MNRSLSSQFLLALACFLGCMGILNVNACLLAALVVVPVFVATSSANSHSDFQFSGIDDYCSLAADPDGIGSGAPTPHDDSCDNDSTVTTESTTINAGLYVTCKDDSSDLSGASATHCDGGIDMFADTATGGGNFGGDYPNATSVSIAATDSGPLVTHGWIFQVSWVDTVTGTQTIGLPSPLVCLTGNAAYFIAVGAAPTGVMPPTGSTIHEIIGIRQLLGCGADVASLGPLTVAGTWTYAVEDNDAVDPESSAIAAISVTDNGDGTCFVDWQSAAHVKQSTSGGYGTGLQGRAGQATVSLIINGQATLTQRDGVNAAYPYGADVAMGTANTDSALYGDIVEAAAAAWTIGGTYKIATAIAICLPVVPPTGDNNLPYSYGPVVIRKDSSGLPYVDQNQDGCTTDSVTATSLRVTCTPPVDGSWQCHDPGLIANADAGSTVTGKTWCNGGQVASATSHGGPVWSGIQKGLWHFAWYCEATFSSITDSGYVLCDAPDPPLLWPF
jgi:hypothetical protein